MGGTGYASGKAAMGAPWKIYGLAKTGSVFHVSISMSWTVPNNAGSSITSYEIYRGSNVGNMAYLGTAVTNSYTDLTATGGGSYYYKVRAVNAVGNGEFSTEVSMSS